MNMVFNATDAPHPLLDSSHGTDAGQHFGHQTCEHFHLVCASRLSALGGIGVVSPLARPGVDGILLAIAELIAYF